MGDDAEDQPGAAGSPARRTFGKWLGAFLLALLLGNLDLFGIAQLTGRASEDVALAAMAPFHHGRGELGPGRAHITVVLVDDAFLAALSASTGARATWPLPRQAQWDHIIAPILARAPSALFLDIVYHQDGVGNGAAGASDAGGLARSIEAALDRQRMAGGPVPRVVLADRPPATDGLTRCSFRGTGADALATGSQVAEPLRALAERHPHVELAAIRFWGPDNRYPLAPLALADGKRSACEPFADDAALVPSPALALFSHWCERDGQQDICREIRSGRGSGEGAFALHRVPDALGAASAPIWGWYQSPVAANLLDVDGACARATDVPPLLAMVRAMRIRWPGTDDSVVPTSRCFAIHTISASALLATSQGDGLADVFLPGRLVLVGTQLDAAPDLVRSPVHGAAPGVMLHAVALENLIADGADRVADPRPWRGLNIAAAIMVLASALVAIPLHDVAERPIDRWLRTRRMASGGMQGFEALLRFLALGGLLLALALLPLALALLVFWQFHWAPGNWLAIVTAKLIVGGTIIWLFRMALERLAHILPADTRRMAANRRVRLAVAVTVVLAMAGIAARAVT